MNQLLSENNISAKESTEELQKITLAIIGTTKSGKTTSIAMLTNVSDRILKIASDEKYGRTGTTVEYHIVPQAENDCIRIEHLDCFVQNIMGSADGNVDKYNEQVKKHKILSDVFKLSQLSKDSTVDEVRKYITQQMEGLINQPASDELLKALMCSQNIDNFVRKIVLSVPANPLLDAFLNEKKIDLRIRDTKGLLDIDMNQDPKSQTSKSLYDLGLDGLNGVIFFVIKSYPNCVQDLYRDTITSVLKSVPIFLVNNQTDFMFESCKVFFASTFWTKLQNIFGHYCMSILDKFAKPWLASAD